MEKALVIPPKDLRKNIKDLLRQKLLKLVEGSCSRRYGYIVAVTHIDLDQAAQGRICEGTGDVTFSMKYNAIVFKPFRNEVLDAQVTDGVTKEGFFAKAGPLEMFISYKNMPPDMKFDDNAVPPLFVGDGGVKIQKDTCVRVKILNTRIDADGMVPRRATPSSRAPCARSACAHAVAPIAHLAPLPPFTPSAAVALDSCSTRWPRTRRTTSGSLISCDDAA